MPTTAEVDAALERFAALDEKDLAQPWRFRDKPMDVRYAPYRTMEDAQEALVRAAARPHPESRRILSLAERAFGDLRGLLIGLPTDLLDTAPREGEWSVREILRHVIVIEGRYAVQTRYAVERADADPMRVADDTMPTPAQTDVTGRISQILARVGEARAETDRRLGDLPAAAMARPTQWFTTTSTSAFRLHRFAAHLMEHTVQCEKALAALGWQATESIEGDIKPLLGHGRPGPQAPGRCRTPLVRHAGRAGCYTACRLDFPLDRLLRVHQPRVDSAPRIPAQRATGAQRAAPDGPSRRNADRAGIAHSRASQVAPKSRCRVALVEGGLTHGNAHARSCHPGARR